MTITDDFYQPGHILIYTGKEITIEELRFSTDCNIVRKDILSRAGVRVKTVAEYGSDYGQCGGTKEKLK